MADSGSLTQFPFRILFEDTHLIVLSKEAGLLSQGDVSGEASLVDLLRIHFGRNYVGLIHRLDRNTSGLMVVAKRTKSAERLTKQLQTGELIRIYHAILFGKIASGTDMRLEHWLLKNESTNEVKVVKEKTPGSKIAVLRLHALKNLGEDGSDLTCARFELETGRSHQIRVQSAALGYPLIGDTKYGKGKSSKLFPRPALHSAALHFFHPMSREELRFSEPYARDMLTRFPELENG